MTRLQRCASLAQASKNVGRISLPKTPKRKAWVSRDRRKGRQQLREELAANRPRGMRTIFSHLLCFQTTIFSHLSTGSRRAGCVASNRRHRSTVHWQTGSIRECRTCFTRCAVPDFHRTWTLEEIKMRRR
jgi:hypothetical protein